MKMIGKVIGMLILAVLLGPSGSGFAETADCGDAASACHKQEAAHNVCDESHSACVKQCASFYKDEPDSQTQSPFYPPSSSYHGF